MANFRIFPDIFPPVIHKEMVLSLICSCTVLFPLSTHPLFFFHLQKNFPQAVTNAGKISSVWTAFTVPYFFRVWRHFRFHLFIWKQIITFWPSTAFSFFFPEIAVYTFRWSRIRISLIICSLCPHPVPPFFIKSAVSITAHQCRKALTHTTSLHGIYCYPVRFPGPAAFIERFPVFPRPVPCPGFSVPQRSLWSGAPKMHTQYQVSIWAGYEIFKVQWKGILMPFH